MENFELDKLIAAVICGLCLLVLSINVGGVFYGSIIPISKPGYIIEVEEGAGSGSSAPKELPAILDLALIFAQANVENGEKIFSKCAVCHTNAKGDANKVGPNLWGIVNAPVARKKDFEYSAAMAGYGATGAVWNLENLYRYIFAPKKWVPGTKMAFAGLKKENELADLVAYLNTLADNPSPLPK
jgi:cytochrome c